MFLTCSYLFPGDLAPSVKKSNWDLRILNRYLEDEVCEVNIRLCDEEWKSLGLETRLVQMEARQQIMMERLDAMNVAPVVVDLTKEEDEGGLGGPIFLAPETPVVSVDTEEERTWVQRELLVELDNILSLFVNVEEDEKTMEGEYTPTGLSAWGPEF